MVPALSAWRVLLPWVLVLLLVPVPFPVRGVLPFPLPSAGVSTPVTVWWLLQCREAGVVAWSLGCGSFGSGGALFSEPPLVGVPLSPCVGA